VPYFGEFRITDLLDHVERKMNAIERAKQLGTYNAVDRSRQYEGATEADYRRAVDEAWMKLRSYEKTAATKAEIKELRDQVESRVWNRIVLVVASAEFALIVMLLAKFAK
jgi:hypothetical protein